ncbi:efflux RND transporter periplasmic adaptor subunit [Dethiosulfatarculus sandiegensis]|uniref:Hemolysin D n=1 Tax=Dethiosulfatarculus sandiegensis TaxID=1429043 RepID=A0A0D2JAJ2_9BACT|nr:efflux RND transporter periplasmic adaptor subunit [Dethiosulfatarculus sandiegensis]KIX15149.1 hemolysin D [Dethiosulfatarculus sandiegensis]
MSIRKMHQPSLLMALAFLILLTGCNEETQPGAMARPAPKVDLHTVEAVSYTSSTELPGRIAARRVAEVRARVAGIVLSRNFKEGSVVKEGQLLFQIDPAPFEAALARAKASLATAEASLFEAREVVNRYKSLVEVGAISPQQNDTAIAVLKRAEAARQSALAQIKTAKLDLGYASVRAPITGRIGRALVNEGSLVGQGEATPMAKIQQLDKIYADVTQPVSDFLRLRNTLKKCELSGEEQASGRVSIRLPEIDQVFKGRLLFSDVTVDKLTGQVSLRSEFSNPNGVLLPGMFVRLKINLKTDPKAIFIPQRAVQMDPKGKAYVMVVDNKNTAGVRFVKTGVMQGNTWQVLEGLKAGEKIVAGGVDKIRPGMRLPPTRTAGAKSKKLEG